MTLVSQNLTLSDVNLYELPTEWIWVALEEVATHISGIAFKSTNFTTEGVQVVRLGNVYRGELDLSRDPVYLTDDYLLKNFILKFGDIVVSQTGTRFKRDYGNFVLIPENVPKLLLNQRLLAVCCHPCIDSKYVVYASRLKVYQNHFFSHETGGVNQGNVGVAGVMKGPIPLAPLNEQRRLVTKIEALKTRSQRVKDALSSIPALLDQFRQSVLAAAFSGALTADWREKNPDVEPAEVLLEKIRLELKLVNQSKKSEKNDNFGFLDQNFIDDTFSSVPTSWEITQIRTICTNSFYGPRFAKDEYVADGIPSIRTTDMTDDGEIILQNPPCINIPQDRLNDFKVLPGDLLVTRSGSIGMMAVFRGEYVAIPSAYLIRFRFNQLVDIDYIFYYLKSPIGQKLLGLNSTSVTQSNINAEAIKNIPIPVPPLEEQKEIVYQIKSILRRASLFKQQYQQSFGTINQLDQSILAEAFRGALVPQDPNDEPASVLLERIRAEREKNAGATSKRGKKSADTSPSQNNKNTGATSKRSNKSEPIKEAIQMELELE